MSGLVVHLDPPDGAWMESHTLKMLHWLGAVVDGFRERSELPRAAVELIVSDDAAAAIRTLHGSVVGVEDLGNFTMERVGGVVAAKTMFRNDDHSEAVVILDSTIFKSPAADAWVTQAHVVAHELAHTYIGQLRSAGGAHLAPSYLPSEVAQWLVRFALEEYLADRLAALTLSSLGSVTLPDGTSRPVRSADVGPVAGEFLSAAGQALCEVADLISRYRNTGHDLAGMWRSTYTATEQILIALAHAESEREESVENPSSLLADLDDVTPLRTAWAELYEIFIRVPLLCPPAEFGAAEAASLAAGARVVLQLWEELGLTFSDADEGFRIHVAHPSSSWPYRDAGD